VKALPEPAHSVEITIGGLTLLCGYECERGDHSIGEADDFYVVSVEYGGKWFSSEDMLADHLCRKLDEALLGALDDTRDFWAAP
jgi:hypothetical protein